MSENNSNKNTIVKSEKKTLTDWIKSDTFNDQIRNAIPKGVITSIYFCRAALTAITRNPKLGQCTQESVFKCLLDLASLGIIPDGRRAHLIPFENKKLGIVECTLIIDYKGLVDLSYRSGHVSSIHADKVCENDSFDVNNGMISHKIDYKKSRGNPYAYYCIIRMKDGTEKHEVMTMDEVESIKSRSKAKDYGPWVSDFDEMAKKTVFKRASKWITLSPEIREAFDKDDESLNVEERLKIAKPIFEIKEANVPDEEKGENAIDNSELMSDIK